LYSPSGTDVAGNINLFTNGSGDLTATGIISSTSDERVKSNIQTIESGLEKVLQMRGVTYDKDGKSGTGVIAQEMRKILPEVVNEDATGMLSVAYGNIVGILIEAIKELKEEINELKKK
jgi:hypothetical protein